MVTKREGGERFVSHADAGEGRTARPSPPVPKVRASTVLAVLCGFAAFVAGMTLARDRVGFQVTDEGETIIQDFSSHLVFSRNVWQGVVQEGTVGSAYTVDAHLKIMSEWVGNRFSFALPFGYSPVMLIVLLPLCFLSTTFAYLVWTGAGALVSTWMVLQPEFHRTLGLIFLVSPVAAGSIAVGQTGILGAVGIFFLARRSLREEDSNSQSDRWLRIETILLSVVLWALAAKPPLAVTAGMALLATGHFRALAIGLGLTVVTSLGLTPLLGSGWYWDYAALIRSYDLVGADPAFAWSLHPEHMSNLRAFLSVDLGLNDGAASEISNAFWILGLGMVVLGSRLRWIRPSEAWGLSILSYLLFCSHVSSTDELLLIVVPAVIFPWSQPFPAIRRYLLWILVGAALLLSPALGIAAGVRPSLLWILELGLLAWILLLILFRGRRRRCGAGSPCS